MTTSTKIRLYKNHMNSIGYWDIWFVDNVIHIEHATCVGCSPVHHTETVHEGKQSRSLREQVISRIKSRVNKQLDKGYVRTIDEARSAPTNTLNFLQPMLAQRIERVSGINWTESYIQPKLDGHRCLITRFEGNLVAYSRQGKIIDTIDHVFEMLADLPEGVTLDGELYCDGVKLQEIASWVKRKQVNTERLSYNVFDLVSDKPFSQRHSDLLNILSVDEERIQPIQIVPTYQVKYLRDFNIHEKLHEFRSMGYEGVIVRHSSKGYEAGRRSQSLVKVKHMSDTECTVSDVEPSKDGWGILVCKTDGGATFRVSAPGSLQEKQHVLDNKDLYIGKLVTVEFSMYTKDKVPFHPVALRFREDI